MITANGDSQRSKFRKVNIRRWTVNVTLCVERLKLGDRHLTLGVGHLTLGVKLDVESSLER